jgi:hypothetical protein
MERTKQVSPVSHFLKCEKVQYWQGYCKWRRSDNDLECGGKRSATPLWLAVPGDRPPSKRRRRSALLRSAGALRAPAGAWNGSCQRGLMACRSVSTQRLA